MQKLEAPWDLLDQPLFPLVRHDGSRTRATLPELLTLLQANEVRTFPTLLDHQQHALHAFLVQVAAIAAHRNGSDGAPASSAAWTERLLRLTDGQHEPWCLVVEDLSKPAFLQPPVPEGNLDAFKKWGREGTRFPDEIDMLVTAKNHDVKSKRIAMPDPSHWVYSLITTQTMDGYAGARTYGIVRMNGGYASRPCVSYSPSLHPCKRFQRDLVVLLSARSRILSTYSYTDNGLALLWLDPWDGHKSTPLHNCDPYFIEVCRRIRLTNNAGQILSFGSTSETRRISGKEANGNTGDPWTPISKTKNAALTIGKDGLSYQRLQQLLSNTYIPGAAFELTRTDSQKEVHFVSSVLIRSEGVTKGYHERSLLVSPKVRRLLSSPSGREVLGALAQARVNEVADIKLRALKPALLQLLQGGPEKYDARDTRADAWLDKLDAAVDSIFFEELWSSVENSDEASGRTPSDQDRWAGRVFDLAEELLLQAFDSLPIPEARRYRAIAAAERIFRGRKKKRLGPRREEGQYA